MGGPGLILDDDNTSTVTNNPSSQGQFGATRGTLWGKHNALRQNFAPVSVRWTNLFTGALPATTTLTVDPLGTTNALLGTNTVALPSVQLVSQSRTLSVGDYFVVGAWLRMTNASGDNTVGELQVNFLNAGNEFQRSGTYYTGTERLYNHPDWQWISGFDMVKTVAVSPDTELSRIYYYSNVPIEICNPVVIHMKKLTNVSGDAAMVSFTGGISLG